MSPRSTASRARYPHVFRLWRNPPTLIAIIVALALFSSHATRADCPPIPPSEFCKTSFDYPDDPFVVKGYTSDIPDWVKFTILACDPSIVYYQDSNEYPFHYHFGEEILAPIFGGMSQSEYNQATLYETGQLAFLGALVLPPSYGYPPPDPPINEYGIQLIRYDAYSREEVRDMFNVIRASVNADPEVQVFYFPTPEQKEAALADSEWFSQQDPPILISDASRWSDNNIVYSDGWALGRLKYFDGDDIEDAYEDGLLTPGDILLTDEVPSEIPYVSGIICLSPSTPNSHVAILAQSYSVPFTYLTLSNDIQRAQQLVGRRMVLRAYNNHGYVSVTLIDADHLKPDQVDEILELKAPPQIDLDPIALYGAYSASTAALTPDDVEYFGGKASNYGILRRAIPDHSPKAAALSFDLWDEFMDQTMPGGGTLRQVIADILAEHQTYPPDMAELEDDLDDIRDMIKDDAEFSPAAQQAVIDSLQDAEFEFDDEMKIRFRSSTNVEDTEHFTGAGLYDSYSGCLADDLDGDDVGPSICDPEENNERGVFRAIRKVFASFYNDNAFLERLRHGVDENNVGMAVLVHHSFPDELELANGVATLEKFTDNWYRGKLVTQYGATSVTNPEGGAVPEEVEFSIYSSSTGVYMVRYSNLVPLGTTILTWRDEYYELLDYLKLAAEQFQTETGKDRFVLDFEYKKVAPGGGALPSGGLVVKQIREIPQPSTVRDITPFLINEPYRFVIEQGEFGDVFSYHRLKSHWRFSTKNMWLTEKNLQESCHQYSSLVYRDECRLGAMAGPIDQWPKYDYRFEVSSWSSHGYDSWSLTDLATPRRYELETYNIDLFVSESESPVLSELDFGHFLTVEYEGGAVEQVPLMAYYEGDLPGEWRQQRSYLAEIDELGGLPVQVDTVYYFPPEPMMSAGYTAPLIRWDQTVITGLTTEPIVLTDFYAQTYQPTHHNITEFFIFEPRLDPSVPQSTLDELDALGVRILHVEGDHYSSDAVYTIYGDDGTRCYTPGDVDYDEDVDLADLAALLASYNLCFGDAQFNPSADYNHDSCVNLADLAELLSHYGDGV